MMHGKSKRIPSIFNPLNAELNPICHLLALLGAHPIFHISRIKVKDESTGSYICLWKLAVAVATYVSICIIYRILPSFAF
jgi:hypothetical protein